MYQLAPDEKRRDYGLNVLDTYFNNGVCRTHTYLITELVNMELIFYLNITSFIMPSLHLHLVMTKHIFANDVSCICGGL